MLIYICNNCNQILERVYQISERTIKKELPFLAKDPPVIISTNLSVKGYVLKLIEERLLYYICPVCGKQNISEVDLTQENFTKVIGLVQENKIKDALELIFEALL